MSDFNWFQKLIGMPKLAEDVADQLRSFRDEDCSSYIDELEDERARLADMTRRYTNLYDNFDIALDTAVDEERDRCNRVVDSLEREMMRRDERYHTEIEALEAQVALLQQELKDCRGN